jgi:hypothetical protein
LSRLLFGSSLEPVHYSTLYIGFCMHVAVVYTNCILGL